MKSCPQYPSYKSSGIEWLGNVPRHWRTEKIKYMISSCGGGTPNTENADYWNGDIPWVSAKDMKRSRISTTEDTITDLGLKESTSRLINENTVLMVVRSGILKHTIPVAINTVPVAINQDMKALFVKEGLEPEFLYYFVEGMQKTLLPLWAKQGCTVESIDQGFMGNTNLHLPSLSEQKAIAAFLDRAMERIDGLIGKREKLIALLQEKRAALISHAVTKGLNPSAKMKPSGIDWLGDIPTHWEVKRLKYNFSLKTERFVTDENPIALENIESWTGRFIPTNSEFEGDGMAFKQGDILFGKLRPYLAKVFLAERNGEAIGDLFVMAPRQTVCPKFAAYLFRTRDFIEIIDGSTFGSKMPRASWGFVGNMPFPLSPLSEQNAIATYLDAETKKIDGLMEREQQIIERMKEYRSALISAAVTGKIDVRGSV